MMKNFIKLTSVLVAGIVLSACAGEKSEKVTALQKKDKNLSCDEVMLEINEAEFYRKTAENNKTPKVKSILMPLGYVSTYMDAEDAVGAADSRIDYLNRIYDILKCDDPKERVVRNYPPHSDYVMPQAYNVPQTNDGGGVNNVKYALVPADQNYRATASYGEWYW